VRILGVDQVDDANKPTVSKAVTVEVTPDQAETIQLAQTVGSVSLTLRHISDAAVLKHLATTAKDLGNFGPKAGPAPSAAPGAGRPAGNAPPKLPPGYVTVTVGRGTVITGYAVSAY
jgi:pilus assembly protein CpaB